MIDDHIHVDLTIKQQKQIEDYIKTHFCDEFKTGAGGFGTTSKISFIVGSTCIGPTLDIYCPYCKAIVDITDLDTW